MIIMTFLRSIYKTKVTSLFIYLNLLSNPSAGLFRRFLPQEKIQARASVNTGSVSLQIRRPVGKAHPARTPVVPPSLALPTIWRGESSALHMSTSHTRKP